MLLRRVLHDGLHLRLLGRAWCGSAGLERWRLLLAGQAQAGSGADDKSAVVVVATAGQKQQGRYADADADADADGLVVAAATCADAIRPPIR